MPNKSISTGIKLAAGAVLLFVILKAVKIGTFANNVLVNFHSFRLGGSFMMPQLFITFSVKNPTINSIKISGINGNILSNNRIIGNVISNDIVTINGNQNSFYEVNFISSIGDVLKFLQAPKQNQLIFSGSIILDGITLPLNFNLVD